MSTIAQTKSAAVRARLKHPVVDGDGHFVEIVPLLHEYMERIGGAKLLERFRASLPAAAANFDGGPDRVGGPKGWYGLTPQQRHEKRVTRGSFWGVPNYSALDRATSLLPNLYRSRMDELGIDFAILYPTWGVSFMRNPDDEFRRVGCRALNQMIADMYLPHADRMTPVASIPMHTPQEALEELDFAVGKLGLKSVVLGTCIRRPIGDVARQAPELAEFATWMDVIGVDSEYDYDPVWQRCVDLKVAVTAHTNIVGWTPRSLATNYVYNHIGHFAASGEAFCKALVLGGVVERFPKLNFAFLEGGVGWACSLFNDLIEHWEKRNLQSMRKYLDPERLDRKAVARLVTEYGGDLAQRDYEIVPRATPEDPAYLDDFANLKIESSRRFAEYFDRFYFGCESDDRITAFAFNPKINHFGTKMKAVFSSDIGHFDVLDITAVLEEAYELVEEGLLTEADFRDFTFTNAVTLHGGMNPDFFKGTTVEGAAGDVLTPH